MLLWFALSVLGISTRAIATGCLNGVDARELDGTRHSAAHLSAARHSAPRLAVAISLSLNVNRSR
jgi:hypothetical protein